MRQRLLAPLFALVLAFAPALAPASVLKTGAGAPTGAGGGGGGDPALPGFTIVNLAATAAAWTGTVGINSGFPLDNGAAGIDIQDSFAGGRHLAYNDYTSVAEVQQFVVSFNVKDSGRYLYVSIVRGDTFATYGVTVDRTTCTQTEAHTGGTVASNGSQVDLLASGRCRVSVWQSMPASAGSEIAVAISDQATGGGSTGYSFDAPTFTGNATHTLTVFPSGT